MKTFEKVYNLVSQIPKGKVLTYKQVALKTKIKDIRVIGWALSKNPDVSKIPCHRVLRSDGTLSPGFSDGGWKEQRKRRN